MSAGFHRMHTTAHPIPGFNLIAPMAHTVDQIVLGQPKPIPPLIEQTLMAPADPRAMGYTGNTCVSCQGTRMMVSGHCEVCADCGSSSGCS